MSAVDTGTSSWFPSRIVLFPAPLSTAVPGPRQPVEPQETAPARAARHGWTIVDATGAQVAAWPTRRQALADLGCIAVRGAHLPLLVHGPDGRATGDRLG